MNFLNNVRPALRTKKPESQNWGDATIVLKRILLHLWTFALGLIENFSWDMAFTYMNANDGYVPHLRPIANSENHELLRSTWIRD